MYFNGVHKNVEKKSVKEKTEIILDRSRKRQFFYEICLKMFSICEQRGLRLIVENPYSPHHYLVETFPYRAAFIDRNRTARGDYFNKPTQYFFISCSPTFGSTLQKPKTHKTIKSTKSSSLAGLCSEERSMIHPDYARNFICDFIIGREQPGTQLNLFE